MNEKNPRARLDGPGRSGTVRAERGGDPAYAREFRELEAQLEEVPVGATVKGMYLSSFLVSLDRAGHARPTTDRFIGFKDYPLTLFMELMLAAVQASWPHLPPREGLRMLGQGAYPTLAASTAGKVLFSVAGKNFATALSLTEKAYRLSLSPGTARLVDLRGTAATLEMRDIWNYADCYQVGVMEGAMVAYGVEGTVEARRRARKCDVDLLLEWW